MISALKGKRVLFIAPMFFGYEKLIKAELEGKGAHVDYFNDRPGADFLTKALIRIDRRLLAKKTNDYYEAILESTRDAAYDHVLIVRGEAISTAILKRIRTLHPAARLTLYLWDSMHYNQNARTILPEFDAVLSFDRVDVSKTPGMEFLPLFYAREFDRAADWQGAFRYDACFIGTIHTDRYKVLEKIIGALEADGRKVFVYCYYPSRILYQLRSLLDPGFRRFARKYVDFHGMKLDDVVSRIAESRTVIDINRPDQRGLTMRSIEAVGAQRRLITTNADIVNYDIGGDGGVLIVDRDHPRVEGGFFAETRHPFNPQTRVTYSVSRWVDRVFNASGHPCDAPQSAPASV